MGTNLRKANAFSDAVSAELRAERARAQMTREQVYEAAGVSRSTYARIEKAAHVVDVAQLKQLCDALGVSPAALLERAAARIAGHSPS